jgi:hypothetical protein
MVNKENKINLIISDYRWEDKLEYTYEIRGYNIYFSEIGFNSYDEAKKEGEIKLNQIKNSEKIKQTLFKKINENINENIIKSLKSGIKNDCLIPFKTLKKIKKNDKKR